MRRCKLDAIGFGGEVWTGVSREGILYNTEHILILNYLMPKLYNMPSVVGA